MSTATSVRTMRIDGAPAGSPAALGRLARRAGAFGRSGLLLGAVASAVVAAWVLFPLGGLDYYRTPVAIRAYAPAHRLLRPAGPLGQMLGMAGAAMMLVPFIYAARKRFRVMQVTGSHQVWLQIHLFCGVAGPVLITLHTAFRFNGLVSAAYWAMVLVMISGFAGRFLYVRLPRSIRGVELTWAELDGRVARLRESLAVTVRTDPQRRVLQWFHQAMQPVEPTVLDLLAGEFALGHRVRALDRDLAAAGLDDRLRAEVVALAIERALTARRAAYLARTRSLFQWWHVFHMPLVWLMLLIVAAHIAVAVYLGYVPYHW